MNKDRHIVSELNSFFAESKKLFKFQSHNFLTLTAKKRRHS